VKGDGTPNAFVIVVGDLGGIHNYVVDLLS
jgi:hypothetical protein